MGYAEQVSMQSDRVNLLQRVVSQSDDMHKKIISGMIFGILAGPNNHSAALQMREQ